MELSNAGKLARKDHIGRHKLDPAALLDRAARCDDSAYWTCSYVPDRSNGLKSLVVATAGRILCLPEQQDYARQAAFWLRDLGHDGRWQVAWTEPTIDVDLEGNVTPDVPSQLTLIWKDKDGDPCITIDVDGTIAEIFAMGWHRIQGDCEAAYAEYLSFIADVGVTPEQTIKRAQGQQSIDPTAQPEL